MKKISKSNKAIILIAILIIAALALVITIQQTTSQTSKAAGDAQTEIVEEAIENIRTAERAFAETRNKINLLSSQLNAIPSEGYNFEGTLLRSRKDYEGAIIRLIEREKRQAKTIVRLRKIGKDLFSRNIFRRLRRGPGIVGFFICIGGFLCTDVTEAAVTAALGSSPIFEDSDQDRLEERIAELERIKRELERELEERNEDDVEDISDRIDDSEEDLDDLDLD